MKRTLNSTRRTFLGTAVFGGTAAAITPLYPALGAPRDISTTAAELTGAPASQVKPFELDEITVTELQAGMKSGKFTARSLVEKYQERIAAVDKHGPTVNSVIELNPTRFWLWGGWV